MSRIEELPNDFDTSLTLNSPLPSNAAPPSLETAAGTSTPFPLPTKPQNDETPLPALPPQMDSVQSHSPSEILSMMKRTPLFMTSLDDAGDDTENVELDALRALQYEGTRAEIALNFREQGNEMAREKRWKDGQEFYTKALLALKQPPQPPPTTDGGPASPPPSDPDEEAEKERAIEEACYINRALCNLELQNYRSCTLDCASTLRLNPSNPKAYYRSTLALLSLSKLREARDALSHALALFPSNSAFSTLSDRLLLAEKSAHATQLKNQETSTRALAIKRTLSQALQSRGLTLRKTAQPPDLEDAVIHLSPDPLSAQESHLVYPLLLLYPRHARTDFIKAVSERETLQQHLEYIFPLPWDEEGSYNVQGVECFMETAGGGMVKVGRKVELGACLGEGKGKGEIVDGVVKVLVVPKGEVREWVEEVKRRKKVGSEYIAT